MMGGDWMTSGRDGATETNGQINMQVNVFLKAQRSLIWGKCAAIKR